MPRRCLIIAHRGASGTEPENTLRSFAAACQMGADGIELDCHLTKDQKVVVSHDQNTKRITGQSKDICQSDYQDLLKLDFGRGERIPLLTEVFDHFLKKTGLVNIEIKSTGVLATGIEEKIAQIIRSFKCQNQVIVSSFNPFALIRLKKIMGDVRLGYLICEAQHLLIRNRFALQFIKPTTINLQKELVHKSSYGYFFKKPKSTWVWTVNEQNEMEFWLDRGVQAIITNYPERLKALLK